MVVDTNVVVYCFFSTPYSDDAAALLANHEVVVPPLWQSEFRNVLTLYLRKELISIDAALEIYALAEEKLNIIQSDATLISKHVLELVKHSTCSAYDCEFVALAKQLEVPLVTQDKKILREFPETALSISDALQR